MPYIWFSIVFYLGLHDAVGWIITIHVIVFCFMALIDIVRNDSVLMEVFETFYNVLTNEPREPKDLDSMILYVLSLDKRENNEFIEFKG